MKSRGACLLALLFAGFQAGGVHAAALGDNTVRLAPSLFKLPQNIGPLRYSGERRFSDRRMGGAFAYNTTGISLNIYVYDHGLSDVPDGPDSVAACEQFESAKREIVAGGNYQNVSLRGEFTRLMKAGVGPAVREAVYEFDRNGTHAISALWVTAADGYFLKLRLSLRAEIADELGDAREEVLRTIAAALAARPLRPAPSPAQDPSIDVVATTDSAAAAAWLAYAVELTRIAGEHPELRPPCGGYVVPGFAAELAARQAALREYRVRPDAARTSSYFNQLERVETAGFLDEYVWYYLRDERTDGTPPPGLDLGAFEPFRERELAAHTAQSGARVRINAVRVLPAPSAG
jgi:hypothetical protein